MTDTLAQTDRTDRDDAIFGAAVGGGKLHALRRSIDIEAGEEWAEAMAQIDAYLDEHVPPGFGCPGCGETLLDNLVWHGGDPSEPDFEECGHEFVRCSTCGRLLAEHVP